MTGNGQTRDQWGWYVGTGFDYMVHKGSLVDVILGVEYQHWETNNSVTAFCVNPGCVVPTGADYQLSARGDLARARFTIKTHGWDIFWAPAPAPVITK